MKLTLVKTLAILAVLALVPAARAQKNKKVGDMEMRPDAAAPVLSQGPVTFYVTIQGQKQGTFKGQSASPGHPSQIQGLQFSLTLTSPRNMATGAASGKAQYSAVTLTKPWDASSPQLLVAAASNENLPIVEFDFVRPGANGQDYTFETIKLTDATISSVKDFVRDAEGGTASEQTSQALEDVSFTFRNISVVNNDGKTSATDDWMQ
jgi:type VI secretion system secreted protein Hcp